MNIQTIITVALTHSKDKFPEIEPAFIVLYGSAAKFLSKIRTNYGDIDMNIFYNRSVHKIYGNKIFTQARPKAIQAKFENAIRKFDIARSLTSATNPQELIQEINQKGSRKQNRWTTMSKMPYVILWPAYTSVNFTNVSQTNYTNELNFENFKNIHSDTFCGYHTIFNDKGEILHEHKESYSDPLHIPTFKPQLGFIEKRQRRHKKGDIHAGSS